MIFAGVQRDKRRRLSGRQRESVYDIQPILRYKFEGYQMCLCTHLFENYTVICSSIFNCCD